MRINKLIIVLTLLLTIGASTNAQKRNFTLFEWDVVQLGYVPLKGGSVGTEVRLNLTNYFSIGYGSQISMANFSNQEALKIRAAKSNVVYGDYYFRNSSTRRLFTGMGLGYFIGGSIEYTTLANGQEYHSGKGGKGFGFAPRVGYEYGHFRVKAQYNAIINKNVSNFLDLSIAFTLCGGLKRQRLRR